MTTMNQMEAKARVAARNDNVATLKTSKGILVVAWDDVFEYYSDANCTRPMDRDEAIDHLHSIEWKA
jgi:hypothetical protein